MKTKLSIFLILSLVFNLAVMAQGDLISAADFMAQVKSNKNLVVIDANTSANYAKSHVTDAINVPHTELYKDGPVEGLIKSPDALADYFGKKGISNTNDIVIYDDGSNKYSSRVYLVLKYLGASNVRILHKDLAEWRKSRIPLTRTPVKASPAGFTHNVDASLLADMAFVKSNMGGSAIIIDARDEGEFNGTAEDSKGHIKGAINMPYKEVLTESGAFKTKAELEAVAKKYGITKDKTVVFYCVTSVRAAVPYVAFKSVLGYPNIKVYDGAYNEWIAANNPIEK